MNGSILLYVCGQIVDRVDRLTYETPAKLIDSLLYPVITLSTDEYSSLFHSSSINVTTNVSE